MPSPTAASRVIHRLVDPADLLDRDAQRGEVAVLAGPAVLLGEVRPRPKPSFPIFRTRSTGKWWSRSHWAAWGAISPLRELADAATELFVLTGQLERHAGHGNPVVSDC